MKNNITYERLSGPEYSPLTLKRRLNFLPFEYATHLTLENLEVAKTISPSRVREYFEQSHEIQREKLVNLMSLEWDFDPSVANAIKTVPREFFVRNEVMNVASWADVNVIDGLCTIESAWLIGYVLTCLSIQAGDEVLLLGSGSGYSASLISSIVGKNGRVTCIENDQDVIARSRNILQVKFDDIKNVEIKLGDALNLQNANKRYDTIWPTLSSVELYDSWKNMLKEGGRIVHFNSKEYTEKSITTLNAYIKKSGHLHKTSSMTELINIDFSDSKKDHVTRQFDEYMEWENNFSNWLYEN